MLRGSASRPTITVAPVVVRPEVGLEHRVGEAQVRRGEHEGQRGDQAGEDPDRGGDQEAVAQAQVVDGVAHRVPQHQPDHADQQQAVEERGLGAARPATSAIASGGTVISELSATIAPKIRCIACSARRHLRCRRPGTARRPAASAACPSRTGSRGRPARSPCRGARSAACRRARCRRWWSPRAGRVPRASGRPPARCGGRRAPPPRSPRRRRGAASTRAPARPRGYARAAR